MLIGNSEMILFRLTLFGDFFGQRNGFPIVIQFVDSFFSSGRPFVSGTVVLAGSTGSVGSSALAFIGRHDVVGAPEVRRV